MPNPPQRCRHLHTDGRQCGSPAVRHEKLCYQHHSARQRPSHTPTLPDPEDLHAVQRGLAELLRLTARELIEDKQAKRLFLILTAAGTNLARLDRQRRAARELDLRQRSLTLAEARLAAQHPAQPPVILSGGEAQAEGPAIPSGCPTEPGCPTFGTVSSCLRWAGEPGANLVHNPVVDPIHDPELGPLAPGPDPEPRPQPQDGCPTFAAVSSPLRWDLGAAGEPHPRHSLTAAKAGPQPHPEQPSPARQRELDAEAAEQIEFDRQENARTEERASLRRAAYQVMYQNLSPENKLKEDERYAAEIANFFGYTLEEIAALPPSPVLATHTGITP